MDFHDLWILRFQINEKAGQSTKQCKLIGRYHPMLPFASCGSGDPRGMADRCCSRARETLGQQSHWESSFWASSSRRCHAQILVVPIGSSRLIKAPIPGASNSSSFPRLFTNTRHSIYLPFLSFLPHGRLPPSRGRAYLKALVDQFSCLFQLFPPDARLELATHGLAVHCSTDWANPKQEWVYYWPEWSPATLFSLQGGDGVVKGSKWIEAGSWLNEWRIRSNNFLTRLHRWGTKFPDTTVLITHK